jgi:transcriptional regulator of acetoin/glycerol metabolism
MHDLPAEIVAFTGRPIRVLETKPVSSTPAATPSRFSSSTAAPASSNTSSGEFTLPGSNGGKRSSAEFSPERVALVEALTKSGGNKAEAARLLGIPRSTFFSRLKKYGFE